MSLFPNDVKYRGAKKMRGFFALLRMTKAAEEENDQRQKQIPSLRYGMTNKRGYEVTKEATE